MGKVSPRPAFFSNEKKPTPHRKKTLARARKNEHPCVSFFIGEISKWLKGVDCKSIRFSVRGFESLSHHHFKNPVQNMSGIFYFLPNRERSASQTIPATSPVYIHTIGTKNIPKILIRGKSEHRINVKINVPSKDRRGTIPSATGNAAAHKIPQ